MSLLKYKNFCKGTILPTLTSGATVVDLTTGHGNRCPNAPFVITVFNSTDYSDAADAFWGTAAECMLVTSDPTASQLPVVTRGYDGTTVLNFNDADKTYTFFLTANEGFLDRIIREDKDTSDIVMQPDGSNGALIESTGELTTGLTTPTAQAGFGLTVGSGFKVDSGAYVVSEGAQLTVASNTITVTHPFHEINNTASSQTVDTINGLQFDGSRIALKVASAAFTVTYTEDDNMRLDGSPNLGISNVTAILELMWRGTTWQQIKVY